ncbi:uncharacterized protein EI90DRAFT_3093204 [Cantharellus anzutake]|uniref:uncharacterized protein n=1 Tax=Cantharellus anzutake TaxID=1750568 RepID=UPI0019040C4C|nr:uncharacterized protein EI90DRAFT_3093204 [Cantharellus anzutake]KAF8312578.1 hypothetical protein EI90DRAFT_3093204 [Cantharellus anzutake]
METVSPLRAVRIEGHRGVTPDGAVKALQGSGIHWALESFVVSFHRCQFPGRSDYFRSSSAPHEDFPDIIFNLCPNLRFFALLSPVSLNAFNKIPPKLHSLVTTVTIPVTREELSLFASSMTARGITTKVKLLRQMLEDLTVSETSFPEELRGFSIVPYDLPSWRSEPEPVSP